MNLQVHGHLSPLFADVMLPFIVWGYPAMVALLLPVILVEFLYLRRCVKCGWWKLLRATGQANAASTLVGVPIVWIILMLCDIPIEAAIDASPWLQPLATTNAHTSPLSQIVYSVLYAPFGLMEVNSPHWVFPLMVLVLFVPFYFLSVWIESGVMHRVLEPSGEVEPTISPKLRRAVGVANLLSYCFLYAVSVLWYYVRPF